MKKILISAFCALAAMIATAQVKPGIEVLLSLIHI